MAILVKIASPTAGSHSWSHSVGIKITLMPRHIAHHTTVHANHSKHMCNTIVGGGVAAGLVCALASTCVRVVCQREREGERESGYHPRVSE